MSSRPLAALPWLCLALLVVMLACGVAGGELGEEPKYTVSIYKKATELPKIPNAKIVSMSNKRGKRYRCLVPPPIEEYAEYVEQEQVAASESVESILARMAKTCYYRIEGWWTYELCINKGVRQFHEQQAEFMLGRVVSNKGGQPADGASSSAGGGAKRPRKPRKTHYVQSYDGGQDCDMTGKPRQVEVHYKCDPDKPSSIVSITEPATCQYVLTFVTPELCKHPDYAVQETPAQTIVCVPVASETAAATKQESGAAVAKKKKASASAAAADEAQVHIDDDDVDAAMGEDDDDVDLGVGVDDDVDDDDHMHDEL